MSSTSAMDLMGESWASARMAQEWRKDREPLPGRFDARSFEMAANDHGVAILSSGRNGPWHSERVFGTGSVQDDAEDIGSRASPTAWHQWQHHFLAALLRAIRMRECCQSKSSEQLGRRNTTDAIGHHQDNDRVVSGPTGVSLGSLGAFSQHRVIQPLGQGGVPITADRR